MPKSYRTAKSVAKKRGATRAPAPLTFAQTKRTIKYRKALSGPPVFTREARVFTAGERLPTVKAKASHLDRRKASDRRPHGVEISVTLEGTALGVHTFPPAAKARAFPRNRALLKPEEHPELLTGFLPDHLDRRVVPQALPKHFHMGKRIEALQKRGLNYATTVFAPDDRYTFNDTSFPWCTVGRVDVAGGWASGTLIGPRHVLTVSHTIAWGPNNTAGWVKFTPSYFDGSEPFGVAWAQWTYYDYKVSGPTIDNTEEQYDYVVCVLDRRIGDITGWMGSRSYTDGWDGGSYWSHVGYPGDLASGSRPSFQNNIALDGSSSEPDEHEIMTHKADVWPGQSGGPMFGWWSGEPWPRVVSVQSWQNTSSNGASGGANLVDLIIRARNDFP
jgi:V8-like Glu-specific endopeptidase